MTIAGILIAFIIIILTLVWVFYPFLKPRPESTVESQHLALQREQALVYYERVLRNIRDLDEDHDTGKILTDEYDHEREIWVSRGVQVLRFLDMLESGSASNDSDSFSIENLIEHPDQEFQSA